MKKKEQRHKCKLTETNQLRNITNTKIQTQLHKHAHKNKNTQIDRYKDKIETVSLVVDIYVKVTDQSNVLMRKSDRWK